MCKPQNPKGRCGVLRAPETRLLPSGTYRKLLFRLTLGGGAPILLDFRVLRLGSTTPALECLEKVMDVNSFKTHSAKPADVERAWYVVDAENQVVGRLASRVATILRGKHKPSYTPHVDCGDFVVIINADKVRFTGKKETDKQYFRYTGYPGGERFRSPADMRARRPDFILRNAVKGMLPKGTLGRQMLRKLKIHAGPDHPHEAQQPQELTL